MVIVSGVWWSSAWNIFLWKSRDRPSPPKWHRRHSTVNLYCPRTFYFSSVAFLPKEKKRAWIRAASVAQQFCFFLSFRNWCIWAFFISFCFCTFVFVCVFAPRPGLGHPWLLSCPNAWPYMLCFSRTDNWNCRRRENDHSRAGNVGLFRYSFHKLCCYDSASFCVHSLSVWTLSKNHFLHWIPFQCFQCSGTKWNPYNGLVTNWRKPTKRNSIHELHSPYPTRMSDLEPRVPKRSK